MEQAEKKLKEVNLTFWNPNAKMEQAVELYDKASTQFKMAKEWDDAGEAFTKAAELYEKLKDTHEACTRYTEAAKVYKNSTPAEAVKLFGIAIMMHREQAHWSTAAKLYKEVALLQEKAGDVKAACKAYESAADSFQAADASASENGMRLKVADISASLGDFKTAIAVYEKVATNALESRMQAYSVKDYLFKAGICNFVMAAQGGDEQVQDLEEALDKYKDLCPAFDGSRECSLLEGTMEAFRAEDAESFTDLIVKYDRISKLDTWTANLLLMVKKVLKAGGPAVDDLAGSADDLSGSDDDEDDLR